MRLESMVEGDLKPHLRTKIPHLFDILTTQNQRKFQIGFIFRLGDF